MISYHVENVALCQVGYATAMDMYIILCLAAVFAALVEFACINFIDTFIKRFKKWEEEQKTNAETGWR